ncbi:MAG: hypothetical protein Tsb0019_01310 [Roseibium sp.]
MPERCGVARETGGKSRLACGLARLVGFNNCLTIPVDKVFFTFTWRLGTSARVQSLIEFPVSCERLWKLDRRSLTEESRNKPEGFRQRCVPFRRIQHQLVGRDHLHI